MKKVISLLLVMVMLLSLCACGGNTDSTQGGNLESQPGGSTQNNKPEDDKTENTECTHDYAESVTKEATCAEEGEKKFTCSKCGDSYTEAIAKREHTFADATCTAPKTCTVCGATEGEALAHSFSDATCTAGQVCSVCGAAGSGALGHSYVSGTCSACGAVNENYKSLENNYWTYCTKTDADGLLIILSIIFENYEYGSEVSYVEHAYMPLSQMSADEVAGIRQEMPDSIVVVNGVEYFSMGTAWNMGGLSYKVEGDTLTIYDSWEEGQTVWATYTRTGDAQFTATYVTEEFKNMEMNDDMSVLTWWKSTY